MTRSAQRSQAGFTLMEMLLVVAISGIIAIPIFAWMVVGFRTEQTVRESSAVAGATNQLGLDFARDISSASVVTVGGDNCAGAGAGDSVAVSILNHDMSARIVYVGVSDGQRGTLVRRTCPPAGVVIDEQVVFDDAALPLATSIVATPSAAPIRPGDTTARVDLSITSRAGAKITVTGSRRTGNDA